MLPHRAEATFRVTIERLLRSTPLSGLPLLLESQIRYAQNQRQKQQSRITRFIVRGPNRSYGGPHTNARSVFRRRRAAADTRELSRDSDHGLHGYGRLEYT
jgi:hypothetical protein